MIYERRIERRIMETLVAAASMEQQDSMRNNFVVDENDSRLDDNRETLSKNERNLPDTLSSNYVNIPLNSAERIAEISSTDDDEKKNNDEDSENLENVANILPRSETSGTIERCELSTNNSERSSVQQESRERLDDSREEASIEDSCESQPVYSYERSSANGRFTKDSTFKAKTQSNVANRPTTLSEDSKLVKIPLPTSSMNIMQSNAQFLNKSRNFLNFITEKSTNIMEKTLLPQQIAVRYNSLMRMSDGSYVAEKKFSEQSSNGNSTEVAIANLSSRSEPNLISESRTIVDCTGNDAKDANSTGHTSDAGFTPKSEAETISVSLDNLQLPASIIDASDSPLKNGDSVVSDKNALNAETMESRIDNTGELDEQSSESIKSPQEDSEITVDSSNGLLRHPVYLTLVRDYAKVREEKFKLADRVQYLEERNRILESQNSGELFSVQLEALEKTVERLTGELRLANANQEELGREYAAANKERESMVMKYAVSEKQLIDTQRARDFAERRYKEIAKDHELLQNKLRQAQSERTRICNILDTKCRELTDMQKDVERLKEDVNVRDVKLKWTQNKLKTEMESQKETQQKLDKATARINDMKEECEQIRRESQEMIRKFQHSEENKAVTLDQQLKEQQARLILERHVTEDKEMLRIQLQKEVDLLKNRQQALIEENNTLSLKIQDSEKERLAYESKLSELKIVADQRQKEIVDLSAKVSHLETLKLQLIHKEQCLTSNEAEVERLRQVNQELQVDMDCCRQREAHMLDFTQKLTDKNVRLQSEFTSVEAKAVQLEQEQGPLRDGIVELRAKVKSLEENLAYEKNKRTEECEILARHLAEQTQLAQNLSQKLEDSQGEIAVLRRKQQISVKEMSRELQQCRKRLEAYESASPSNSLDPTSRTGSNTSLNTGETLNGVASDHSGNGEATLQSAELDRQSLIDRILKMQKINVRRAEKLDFLEEHTRTLVAELQKKTKIIQNYILHENFDAMGSNERDRHKAELARHGGIMASVYNHRVSDDNMTLELSLEINQKLQAVLEDALLKNITLKDNIDTLGEEIARLTIKNQQMLQQKGK